jgi:hypothetical protein
MYVENQRPSWLNVIYVGLQNGAKPRQELHAAGKHSGCHLTAGLWRYFLTV